MYAEAARQVILTLPKRHQLILSLYYIDDLCLNDIARVVDIPPAKVFELYLEALSEIQEKLF